MKIVIAGLGKSGTSALTYKIAGALPDCQVIFEPKSRRPGRERGSSTVVKLIINTPRQIDRTTGFDDYDRRICLIRDPRDQMVSMMLYSWYAAIPGQGDFTGFMRLLGQKEKAPGSVGFLELAERTRQSDRYDLAARTAPPIVEELLGRGWHPFRYEDMVEGHFEALEAYLDLKIPVEAEVHARYARVARSKSAGSWRHWLTPADVALLRPRFDSALASLGYPDDWSLADPQVLDPVTGSGYVRRLRGGIWNRARQLARWTLHKAVSRANSFF